MVEKRKKPKFVRQGYGIKKSLGDKWRRPKGHQSKMRRKMKGHRKMPSKGYRNPKEIRGKIDGKDFYTVRNVKDIDNIPEGSHVIISSGIGVKKLLKIVESLKKKKIKILNKEKLKKLWDRLKEIKLRNKEQKKSEEETNEKAENKGGDK